MAKEEWIAPPDPDFSVLAEAGWEAWKRDQPELIAFDTETTGLEFFNEPFCVTMAWRTSAGLEAHYFEISHKYDSTPMLKWILPTVPKMVGHNIKFDLQKVLLKKLLLRDQIKEIHDTEPLSHLDDEHRVKKLKSLAVSVLGIEDYIEVETKSGPNKGTIKKVPREEHELAMVRRKLKIKKDDGYHLLPRATIVPYAIKDAEFTLLLYEALRPKIEAHDDLWSLYLQEMELTLTLLDMEARGMGVDLVYVNQMLKAYSTRVLEHELRVERIVGRTVGKGKEDFNPNSNPQLTAFFTEQGFPSESYDEKHLKTIDHPLAKTLVELRSDQKILNTYFRALKKGTIMPAPEFRQVAVFHPSIRQHGTVTGRTSAGGQEGD